MKRMMEFFFLSSFTSLHQRQEAEAPDSVANFVWFHAEERLKEQTVLLSVEFLSPHEQVGTSKSGLSR